MTISKPYMIVLQRRFVYTLINITYEKKIINIFGFKK